MIRLANERNEVAKQFLARKAGILLSSTCAVIRSSTASKPGHWKRSTTYGTLYGSNVVGDNQSYANKGVATSQPEEYCNFVFSVTS